MATGSVKGAWLNQRYQIKDHDDPTERRKKTSPRKTNSILALKLEVKKKEKYVIRVKSICTQRELKWK